MRKKVVSMLLATIMAASILAGCGSGNSESGDAESGGGSGTSDEAYDLTLYSINTTDPRISRFLNTSIDFLIGSVPYPTIISSEDEEDIVLYYRTMSKTGRRLLMGALEDFKDR